MARRQRDEFSITPLPRERRSSKIQRYILALAIATVIAASLVVIASVIGLAVAPMLERSDADVLEQAGRESG